MSYNQLYTININYFKIIHYTLYHALESSHTLFMLWWHAYPAGIICAYIYGLRSGNLNPLKVTKLCNNSFNLTLPVTDGVQSLCVLHSHSIDLTLATIPGSLFLFSGSFYTINPITLTCMQAKCLLYASDWWWSSMRADLCLYNVSPNCYPWSYSPK